MKRNLVSTFITMLLIAACYTANSQPLVIIEQDYEKAVKESKQQNKLLLIDFYTTWCVPCKFLDKTIFQDTSVSNQIAKKFILLKYNAEKDSTYQLSLKHHISFYPTTMILNADELVLSRLYGLGGMEKDLVKNYINLLQEAISRNDNKQWIKGVSPGTHLPYPEFYKEYVYRVNTKDSKEKVAQYWQSLPVSEYFNEVPFAILCYFNGGPETINTFFFNNRKKYEELYGELDTRFVTSMLLSEQAYTAVDKKDRNAFNKAMELVRLHFKPDEAKNFNNQMEEKMLQKENRWKEAAKKFAVRRSEQGLEDESTLYFCQTALEQCKDKQVLAKCSGWMKNITDKKPSYEFLDTYARLLHITGKTKKGIEIMEKAIATGKAQKEDTRSSEAWLLKNK